MKKVFTTLIFLSILIGIVKIINDVTVTNDTRVYQMRKVFYEQEPNSLDAVILGASDAYAYFQSPLAYEKYGITFFPFASGTHSIRLTQFTIKEARKTQPDAVFVIIINSINFPINQSNGLHLVTDYMPLSKNKYDLIQYAFEDPVMKDLRKSEFYFPLLRYHTRWDELKKDDFSFEDGMKGGQYYSLLLNTIKDVTGDNIEVDEVMDLPESDLDAFNNLLDYCDENHVKAVFVASPKSISDDRLISWWRKALQVASARGYPIINMVDMIDDLGLDKRTDYYNSDHANIHGSIKTTDFLSEYLVEHFNLADKRGNENYSDWDEAVRLYHEKIDPYVLPIELDVENMDYSIVAPTIKSVKEYGTKIRIDWAKVSEADGYVIYRKYKNPTETNNTETIWEELVRIDSDQLSYDDTGLSVGTTYTYTVVPYRTKNNQTVYGNHDYSGKSATALMDNPELFEVLDTDDNGVYLRWNQIPDADGYKIYRRIVGSKWTNITEVIGTTDYYDTQSLKDISYEYLVRAYFIDETTGNQVLGSVNVDPMLCLREPKIPAINLEKRNNSVVVSWPFFSGISGFSIYRSEDQNEWQLLKDNISNMTTQYEDKTIEPGKTYYYKLVGFIKNRGDKYEFFSNSAKLHL